VIVDRLGDDGGDEPSLHEFKVAPDEGGDSDDEDAPQRVGPPLLLGSALSAIAKCVQDARNVTPEDPSNISSVVASLKKLVQLAAYELVEICPSLAKVCLAAFLQCRG